LIDARHQAEQRGHFEPLGRVLSFETAHGVIQFGMELGEGTGPDLAVEDGGLIVLGAWSGLPALCKPLTTPRLDRNKRPTYTGETGSLVSFDAPGAVAVLDNVPCPKCRHACNICDGEGQKQCQGLNCGGRGWIPGNWISCPGPGCRADTGTFKGDCATCAHSPVRGLIQEEMVCPMCGGSKVMACEGCRGTKKISTGRLNGSLDYRLPACKACGGTGWKSQLVEQDLAKFTNAILGKYLALGPIYSFTVKDYSTMRPRTFEVSVDSAGDFLMLMVPASARQKPQKAYLVGGVVRERGGSQSGAV
jgi:hypothetical protein